MKTTLFIKAYHNVIPAGTKANLIDTDFAAFAAEGFVQEISADPKLGCYVKSIVDIQIQKRNEVSYRTAKLAFAETFSEKNKEDDRCEIVSNYIIDAYKIKTIRDTNCDEFWYEYNGVYQPNGNAIIMEVAYDFFGKYIHSKLLTKLELLTKVKTFIEPGLFFNNVDEERIGVANGILNLTTRQLEYDKKGGGNIFVRIPVKYDETKHCPNFEAFLNGILDSNENINAVQELLGYSLLPVYKYEKIFILTGFGRNGKSKLLQVIKSLVGQHNSSGHSLQTLQEKEYCLADLHNKLVNIGGDISNEALKSTDIIKQTTGRDLISANRKFKTYLNFTSYAKQIFACNELPMIYDSSLGFWNRINRLDFPFTFYEKSEILTLTEDKLKFAKVRDENIMQNILTADELSGILNYALNGLEMLRASGEFSNSQETDKIRSSWLKRTSSFYAYVCQCFDFDATSEIHTDYVSELYDLYCEHHALDQVPANQRAEQVRKFSGKPVIIKQKKIDGEKVFLWRGIKFKQSLIDLMRTKSDTLFTFDPVLAVPSVLAVLRKLETDFQVTNFIQSDGTGSTGSTARNF